jgi:hypothetical protein
MLVKCPKCGVSPKEFLTARIKFQFRVIWLITIDQEITLPIPKIMSIMDVDIDSIRLIVKILFPGVLLPDTPIASKLNFYHCWNCGQTEVEVADTGFKTTLSKGVFTPELKSPK